MLEAARLDVPYFGPMQQDMSFNRAAGTTYSYLVNAHWSPDAVYTFVNLQDPALAVPWPSPALADVVPIRPPGTLVIGDEGQLGRALRGVISETPSLAASDLDLTDTATVEHTGISTAQYAEDQKTAGRLVAPRPKNSTLASTRRPVTER